MEEITIQTLVAALELPSDSDSTAVLDEVKALVYLRDQVGIKTPMTIPPPSPVPGPSAFCDKCQGKISPNDIFEMGRIRGKNVVWHRACPG